LCSSVAALKIFINLQVLKETLRMWPPAATSRVLPVGYRLGDHVVDIPNNIFVISSYVVHHDPEVAHLYMTQISALCFLCLFASLVSDVNPLRWAVMVRSRDF